jgi:hypothetical protein
MESFVAEADLGSVIAILVLVAAALEVVRIAARRRAIESSQPSHLYLHLRERALHMQPPIDAASTSAAGAPFALVTDLGYATGTATILTTAGGDASIYFSRDGSFVRSCGNPGIRSAARWSVEIASESIECFRRSECLPLAREGEVNFHLISADGVRSARISMETLGRQVGVYTNLFAAVKRVLLSFRAVSTTGELR